MTAATMPRPARCSRLMVIDEPPDDRHFADLPDLVAPGDLLVVNDAFTLPASLSGRVGADDVEIRLVEPPEDGRAWAVVFGAGTWRTPTERRLAPPPLDPHDTIEVGPCALQVRARHPTHPRLVQVEIDAATLWTHGRPVQYCYLARDLHLVDIQTPYAAHPWAVEMPSAGRALTLNLQRQLIERGASIRSLTHAAGLSSTGDPALDAALPLPERYRVPEATWAAVGQARRVLAVGTSVVRALESAARGPRAGVTDLRIGPTTELRVVDGLLSGVHEPGSSHSSLMEAFVPRSRLLAAHAHATAAGYLNHEFGDSTLVWRS